VFPIADRNPTSRRAVMVILIIAANIAAFLALGTDETDPDTIARTYEYAAIPCEVVEQRPLTVEELQAPIEDGCVDEPVTPELFPDKNVWLAVLVSLFLHAGVVHLFGNMWFLLVFANNVEDRLGRIRFLLFYLAGGVVATVVYVLLNPLSTVPLLGASGAVAAVLGAYLVWFPDAPVLTLVLFVPIRIRAVWWLGIWFASQFLIADLQTNVAWEAHVAGFVFGVLIGLVVRSSRAARRRMWRRRYVDEVDRPVVVARPAPPGYSPVTELRGFRSSSGRHT
jgi:membrane associated rhomboid family serine protease